MLLNNIIDINRKNHLKNIIVNTLLCLEKYYI